MSSRVLLDQVLGPHHSAPRVHTPHLLRGHVHDLAVGPHQLLSHGGVKWWSLRAVELLPRGVVQLSG